MAKKIEFPPELLAEAKRLYEETDTLHQEIAAMLGVSRNTLRDRIRELGWQRRPHPVRALEFVQAVRGASRTKTRAISADEPLPGGPVTTEQRAAFAQRILKVIEREMTTIERILDEAGASGQSAGETNTRALIGIARTLREIALLNRPEDVNPPDEADDDPIPRDIDEFRNELACRINAFIDARQASESGRIGEDPSSLG